MRMRALFVTPIISLAYLFHLTAAFGPLDLPWNAPRENTNDGNPSMTTTKTQIEMPHGISAEVLSSLPIKSGLRLPPLLFLHGSFHSSWCWAEQYFPYFVELGYPVAALSWRGTNGTYAGDGVKKVKASEHCEDLASFLEQIPKILGKKYGEEKPVIISHSFGGIIVMKFLESCEQNPSDLFSGIVSMCSVPPSGNGKMTLRFLRRSLVQSWKITRGFAMKACINDKDLCRDLFFGGRSTEALDGSIDDLGVSDEDLSRYQAYFEQDTKATIDLIDLAKNLPSQRTDEAGRAPFHRDLPPCIVIGGQDDYIVDKEGNEETAKYYGLKEVVYVDSPHDVMLGRNWQNAAKKIDDFVRSLK